MIVNVLALEREGWIFPVGPVYTESPKKQKRAAEKENQRKKGKGEVKTEGIWNGIYLTLTSW